jgi:hypothetical protein
MPKWAVLPEDDPLRAAVPIGIPLLILVVIGAINPIVVALAVFAGMLLVALVVGYLLIRFVGKFVRENTNPGGILESWRPSVRSGLLYAIGVLLRWAPFGFLSLLVFGANGLIVHWISQLVEQGVVQLRSDVSELAGTTDSLRSSLSWILPSPLEDAVRSAASGLKGAEDALRNLLVLLRIVLVVESFVSWIFLIWLTTRSVTYFLARTVLAERAEHDVVEESPIEVRFTMEFLR